MTRMIERWFPCQEVSENSKTGWGSGNSEKELFTWFAGRPTAQAKAAVICSLLPWPDDPAEQRRLQDLVRRAISDKDAFSAEVKAEIERAHGHQPSLLDPFSGRALIPLEAGRLGVRALGVDYSPVATVAGAVLADFPFRAWDEPNLPLPDLPDLAATRLDGTDRMLHDVRKFLAYIDYRLHTVMRPFYPAVNGLQPWGYLWVTAIQCQECGRSTPLTGSLVLQYGKKGTALVDQSYSFEVNVARQSFDVVVSDSLPTRTPTLVKVEGAAGKTGVCVFCDHPHEETVIKRLFEEGRWSESPILAADAVQGRGKVFRKLEPDEVGAIKPAEAALRGEPPFAPGIPAIPDEEIPVGNGRFFTPMHYGATKFGDMCNPRQTLSFVRLAHEINGAVAELRSGGVSNDYSLALASYATAVMVRKLKRSTRGATLEVYKDGRASGVSHIFKNQASISYSHDYLEVGLGSGSGTWAGLSDEVTRTLAGQITRPQGLPARIERGSALSLALPDAAVDAVVTDPPYDEMIPYSDGSDLFYVWLKRALVDVRPDLAISSDPRGVQEKYEELIVKRTTRKEPNEHRTAEWYRAKLGLAFAEARRVVKAEGVVSIVFGHGDPDVWHRLLTSVAEAGLVLTGSWPARTESGGKAGYANIETTLTLACRPAAASRPSGRVAEVDGEVRREIMERIPLWDTAGLALTDQLMASAGPAMEVVGRYAEVLDKAGRPVDLDRYLPLARRFVEEAADIKVDTLPLETFDARTRFALFWVRLFGRSVAAASEARWQRLASDLSDEETAGLLTREPKGIRFAFATDASIDVAPESPAIDVALAVAGVGKSVASVAEVLVIWAAMGELSRLLPDADRDGDTWTWVVRNRNAITGASRNVEAAKAGEDSERERAERQATLFGGED